MDSKYQSTLTPVSLSLAIGVMVLVASLSGTSRADIVSKYITPGFDSLHITERPFVKGTESVVKGPDTLVAGADYVFSDNGEWLVLQRTHADTIRVEYLRLQGLSVPSRRFAPQGKIPAGSSGNSALRNQTESRPGDTRFDIAGSKKLSFGVGRSGGLVEQSLWLSLSGKVGRNLTVEGTISDRSTATQSITRRPSEFEKLSLRAYGPGFESEFGDTELNQRDFELFNMKRRLSGLRASGHSGSIYGGALMGERRGQFKTRQFYGEDGKQGPYFLGTGNRVAVVPGSESVWIDGNLLVSGVEQDYEIDYPTGALTFSSRRPVSRELRISADYEVAADAYPSFVYQASAGVRRSGWDVAWLLHREWDDADHPKLYSLTDADRAALELAGDSATLARRSGVDSVGAGFGNYVRDSSSGEFVFVGSGAGEFNITFSFVGPGAGGYRAVGDGSFVHVGDSLGDYAPVIALPLPTESRILALRAGHTAGARAFRLEWAQSENDPNRLSAQSSNSHSGAAWLGTYDWDAPEQFLGAGVAWRHREARFAAQGRDVDVEYSRLWGDAQGSTPGDEDEIGTHVRIGTPARGARVALTHRSSGSDNKAFRTEGNAALDVFGNWQGVVQVVRGDRLVDFTFDQASLKWRLPSPAVPVELGVAAERRVELGGYRFVEMQAVAGTDVLNIAGRVRRTDSLTTAWALHNDLYAATGVWQHRGVHLRGGLTLNYLVRSFSGPTAGTDDRVLADSRWTWRQQGWSLRVEHRLTRAQALSSNEEYVPVGAGRGDYREENGQIIPDPLGDLIRVVRPLAFGALARQSEKRANVSWQSSSQPLRFEVDLVTIETASDAELPGVAWLAPWTTNAESPTQRRVLRAEASGGSRELRWNWGSEWQRRQNSQSSYPQAFERLSSDGRLRFKVTEVWSAELRGGVGTERDRALFPYDFRFLNVGVTPAWRLWARSELTLPVFGQRYWQTTGGVLADWQKAGVRVVVRPDSRSRIVVEPSLNHVRSFGFSLPLAVAEGRPVGTSAEWRIEGALDLSGSVVGRVLYLGRSQPGRTAVHRADVSVEAAF